MADPVPATAPADRRRLRLVHREVLLLAVLAGIAVAAFVFTRAVAAGNERMRRQDAASWYDAGMRDLTGGRPDAALAALRRAVSKDQGNKRYQVALAAALAMAHQDESARQVLVGLRDAAPEDAGINTELARLEARQGDLVEARRHYQNALNAVWSAEQSDVRRALRVELIHLLLDHDEKSRALSEVLLLSANLPDTPAAHVEAGRLFLDAGDPRHALDQFAQALALEPQQAPALTGAGEAAFALGDYGRAHGYLAAAPHDAGRVAELHALADLVLANDPLALRLSEEERTRRLLGDVQQAAQRVAACLTTMPAGAPERAGLESVQREALALASTLTLRAIRASPDAIETGVELFDRMEQRTQRGCAPVTPRDRALRLIGRLHGIDER